MPNKVWGEISYPFPNFNGVTNEVWEWIDIINLHYVMIVIIIHAVIKVNAHEMKQSANGVYNTSDVEFDDNSGYRKRLASINFTTLLIVLNGTSEWWDSPHKSV